MPAGVSDVIIGNVERVIQQHTRFWRAEKGLQLIDGLITPLQPRQQSIYPNLFENGRSFYWKRSGWGGWSWGGEGTIYKNVGY